MDSHTLIIILITIAVCALIGVGIWIGFNQMRSRRLKDHFGPEYDRTVRNTQNRSIAEAELESREQRVKKYRIVALSEHDRTHYQQAWDRVQNRFVDDPRGATKDADELIFQVMQRRGYPVSGFDQAAADLSVEYPVVVENYRAASAIARRNRDGAAGTEDLRQALIYYRTLFHELLKIPMPTDARTIAPASGERSQPHRVVNKRGGLRA
jgi:hypothetical protein